ncbi:MAG: hypothetical protein Ct9H300mP8_00210 [Gammaproteobacteria bacterium]|nr:MAG: hypothetical protein Ct9H300mP8_00210 [Gammaproteobacteria bacterium]
MRMAVTMGDASALDQKSLFGVLRMGNWRTTWWSMGMLYPEGRRYSSAIGCAHPHGRRIEPSDRRLPQRDRSWFSYNSDLTPGIMRKDSGAAARAYVDRATKDALKEEVAGIVTLPVNKEATRLSDPHFIGHTELIAQLCDVQNYSMMLVTDDVAVSHVSTHVPLTRAIQHVTKHKVRSVIELTHTTLSTHSENPRIAVCGLNPHASENGLFGDEEKQHITPAINESNRSWN